MQIEQRPENFRTMEALQRTMAHLRAIMDSQASRLVEIHKFLWDRFRGVRQDLFVQGFEVGCQPFSSSSAIMILAYSQACAGLCITTLWA